jgi:myo-inositol-1(or 4)-monophosphatase
MALGAAHRAVTDAQELVEAANNALDRAKDLVLRRSLGRVRAKDDRDFVSDLDIAIEREVRALLRERTPGIGFLGEEEGWSQDTGNETFWTLDPVDGTTNLLKSLPLCAISLALVVGDRPAVGMVDAPFLSLRYTAVEGEGAFLAGERLRTSRTDRIEDAVVSFGDYAVGEGAAQKNRLRLAVTEQLAPTVQRVRMFGSAALDLAWLAEGKLDAAILLSNKPWDTAAGVLLAREAGARIADRAGLEHTIHSDAAIGAGPALIGAVLRLVQQAGAKASPSRGEDLL